MTSFLTTKHNSCNPSRVFLIFLVVFCFLNSFGSALGKKINNQQNLSKQFYNQGSQSMPLEKILMLTKVNDMTYYYGFDRLNTFFLKM